MKKLDKLVIKSFIGPFILTFFIAQFVLVMQFLWKYVDDLVGKGLSTPVLIELMLYASARLVPMALPLAVLLSSIMTYGSFGEHLELTAVKAAGISLLRFMRALIITVLGISVFAFYFSNYMLPQANLKFGALLYDIRHQKPTVALKPGIFYSGIDGFYIKADKKDDETSTLFGITVYDHTSGKGNDHVIIAQKGFMEQDDNSMSLLLRLEKGRQYREIEPKETSKNEYEAVYTTFDVWEKRFDLSQFKLSRTDENFFKDLKQMLDLKELYVQLDTLAIDKQRLLNSHPGYVSPYFNLIKFGFDSIAIHDSSKVDAALIATTLASYDRETRIGVIDRAINRARNIKNFTDVTNKQVSYKEREITSYMIEVYRKFTLSIACLVLFFIGAPLGSIIRKGGLGWPLFYCVLFFIMYHVTSIIGEKMAENEVLTAFGGMWLSTFVLLPLGLFLTLKAANDSKLFSADFYIKSLRKIIKPATAKQ